MTEQRGVSMGNAAVPLAHASLQAVAEDAGVDILHIKGPAVDSCLLEKRLTHDPTTRRVEVEVVPRRSIDADVLVRPSQVFQFFEALESNGWRGKSKTTQPARVLTRRERSRWVSKHFENGSSFRHDTTFTHAFLHHADVHRSFPGIRLDPEAAFELMWSRRSFQEIANYPCWVPSVTTQRLILILHAARGNPKDHPDIVRAWNSAGQQERQDVDRLASELDAQVALAAGTGRLRDYQGARDYDLWRILASPNRPLTSLWWARVRAETTVRSGLQTGLLLAVPSPARLGARLGRKLSHRELRRAYLSHFRRATGAVVDAARRRNER